MRPDIGTRRGWLVDVHSFDSGLATRDTTIAGKFVDRHVQHRKREKVKEQKYAGLTENAGLRFRPLVVTEEGALGPSSRRGMRKETGVLCPRGCRCEGKVHGTAATVQLFKRWMVRLSFAVARGLTWWRNKALSRWRKGMAKQQKKERARAQAVAQEARVLRRRAWTGAAGSAPGSGGRQHI